MQAWGFTDALGACKGIKNSTTDISDCDMAAITYNRRIMNKLFAFPKKSAGLWLYMIEDSIGTASSDEMYVHVNVQYNTTTLMKGLLAGPA